MFPTLGVERVPVPIAEPSDAPSLVGHRASKRRAVQATATATAAAAA